MAELFEVSRIATDLLGQHGFEAFVVGGFARNIIMNIPPADIDICTNALPGEIINVFKDFKVIETGIKHGTVTVIINGIPAEITTYRIDGEYINHRKPENVIFTSSLLEDLKRRDFTMNAIAYRDKCSFFDPFNGKNDIENKIIRCVGNPETRFKEDALRILRALRFSSVLGFEIEPCTRDAIMSLHPLLSSISKERITEEMLKLLKGDNVVSVLKEYSRVFSFLSGFDISSVAESISLSEKDDIIRLSQLPNTDFLCLSGKQKKQIEFIKNNKNTSISSKEDVLRLLSFSDIEKVSYLIRYLKSDTSMALLEDIKKSGDCYKTEMLCINGTDIINLGFSGKEIGNILSKLLEAVIKNETKNKKEALLDYIKKYF